MVDVPPPPPPPPTLFQREDEGHGTRQNASPASLLPSLPSNSLPSNSLPSNEKTRYTGRVKTRPLPASFSPCLLTKNKGHGTRQNVSPASPLPFLPLNEKTRDPGLVLTPPLPPSFPPSLST